ncbi:putative F-box domain-containing protein [Rosa chinensis]|uniref:Putative F-box domain-containing protein n=1 Tax=Rosa chinensis TaxID=74649 RepID=A0A2P6S388_ROSCH|nr:putative F-box domain-containing protein [Rosa chinensis]
MPTTIDDIPDLVLVEILCRLPCKFLFQCKCVSKSWCTLIQDPYLSGRFMRLQSDRRTPVVSTVINTRGEECLTTLWPSTCKPLTRLFKKLMRFYHLIEKPNVPATYNDLVLCCSLECSYQGDYYICNPYTMQWARLPPPPRFFRFVATGFICDLPHYNHKKEDDPKGNIIQLNAEYRYKVVRIISTDMSASKFEVQMFSSETGKWKESIVSSPWKFSSSVVHHNIKSFAFNGMLYWMDMDKRFLIQLETFSGDIGDQNAWRFVHFGQVESRQQCCVGIFKGRLLIGEYNFPGGTLSFGELSED